MCKSRASPRHRDVVVLGIDTSDFAAFPGGATTSHGELCCVTQSVGADDRGVIVDSKLFWDFQLKFGDPIRLQVKTSRWSLGWSV